MSVDYRKYSDLERYLFGEVGPRIAETGEISPADFYVIIIWKANRAKTRVRDRLNKRAGGFAGAVKAMAASLHASTGPKQRLEVVMREWGFRLPIASAILTVLYPDDFTVYDRRVCGQAWGLPPVLDGRAFSDQLWDDYQRFLGSGERRCTRWPQLAREGPLSVGRSLCESVVEDLEG